MSLKKSEQWTRFEPTIGTSFFRNSDVQVPKPVLLLPHLFLLFLQFSQKYYRYRFILIKPVPDPKETMFILCSVRNLLVVVHNSLARWFCRQPRGPPWERTWTTRGSRGARPLRPTSPTCPMTWTRTKSRTSSSSVSSR
jgi:hypothetical protein